MAVAGTRKSLKRPHVYDALRRKGMSKEKAARISNAGRTARKRRAMAKKAVRTKRTRYGKRLRR